MLSVKSFTILFEFLSLIYLLAKYVNCHGFLNKRLASEFSHTNNSFLFFISNPLHFLLIWSVLPPKYVASHEHSVSYIFDDVTNCLLDTGVGNKGIRKLHKVFTVQKNK